MVVLDSSQRPPVDHDCCTGPAQPCARWLPPDPVIPATCLSSLLITLPVPAEGYWRAGERRRPRASFPRPRGRRLQMLAKATMCRCCYEDLAALTNGFTMMEEKPLATTSPVPSPPRRRTQTQESCRQPTLFLSLSPTPGREKKEQMFLLHPFKGLWIFGDEFWLPAFKVVPAFGNPTFAFKLCSVPVLFQYGSLSVIVTLWLRSGPLLSSLLCSWSH